MLPQVNNSHAATTQNNQTQTTQLSPLEKVWITGDLTPLTPEQRVQYYVARCERSGLDPATQPFEYMELQGKLVLYAKKTATDQLALQHKLSVTITEQGMMPGSSEHYYARALVTSSDGRTTEDQAVLWLKKKFFDKRKPFGSPPEIVKLEGEDLSNAIMKCITKAKRRTIIAHTGLGMLDETEAETINNEKKDKEKTHSPDVQNHSESNDRKANAPVTHEQKKTPVPTTPTITPKAAAPVSKVTPRVDHKSKRDNFTFPASSVFSNATIEEAAQHASDKDLADYVAKLEPQVLKKAKCATAYLMTGTEYEDALIHKTILMRFRVELESRAKQGSKGPQAVVVNSAVTSPTEEQVAEFDADFDNADQAEMGV